MARLIIEVDAPTVDPALFDPEELADSILYSYEQDRKAGFDLHKVEYISARWE